MVAPPTPNAAQRVGLVVAQIGAGAMAVGGLGDQAVRKLLPSHEAYLGVAPGAVPPAVERLFLAVLHALGSSLIAVGLGALVLVRLMAQTGKRELGLVVIAMALLGDGVNAYAIRSTGSMLFVAPLSFVLMVVAGVGLYAMGPGKGG